MATATGKLSVTEKVGYGFGDLASNLFWQMFSIFIAKFYTDVFLLGAAAMGTMNAGHPRPGCLLRPDDRHTGYYDRIGLLPPSGRTDAGYRYYKEADRRRLDRICRYRQAGLSLADIRNLLASAGNPSFSILEKRFREIGDEIRRLKSKQDLLSCMMKGLSSEHLSPEVDKVMWVAMLRAAGMDDQAMERWHGEFEARAPQAHHAFLLSLGIPEEEAREIRKWSEKYPKSENKKGNA